ncbi:MAG: signal peptidase I [Acidobacteria bacterium]|nr:signal peptidase I [Acidobacteriota bacterium]
MSGSATHTRVKRLLRRLTVTVLAVVVITVLGQTAASLHAVVGYSDAPAIIEGDLILVNRIALGLRFPFRNRLLLEWGNPARGEIVLIRVPRASYLALKRIVGMPGDTIAIVNHHLVVNGHEAIYGDVPPDRYVELHRDRLLGSRLETEVVGSVRHIVSYTPGLRTLSSFGPVTVPEGQYFLLGDNRDYSRDSRSFGPVPRADILGRMVTRFTTWESLF